MGFDSYGCFQGGVAMSINFLDHIKDIEDPRRMILYPLDKVLFTVLIGLLCRAEDFDEIDALSTELLD